MGMGLAYFYLATYKKSTNPAHLGLVGWASGHG
jgi:hypothetical protein